MAILKGAGDWGLDALVTQASWRKFGGVWSQLPQSSSYLEPLNRRLASRLLDQSERCGSESVAFEMNHPAVEPVLLYR